MLKAKVLKKGDTIGIVAPSSLPENMENIDKALAYIENMGFKVKEGKAIRNIYGYLSGKDEERLEDIHTMFLDKTVDGIFALKGGYGSPRIANLINVNIIKENPKFFAGYSDITSLHMLFNNLGLITFHAPMPASDMIYDEYTEFSKQSLEDAMFSTSNERKLENPKEFPLKVFSEGKVTAPIVGGNLSLIVKSIGTNYEIDLKNKILFIEEVEEEPYKVDGMLSHIKNAGLLDDCAGILLGNFNNCEETKQKSSLTIDEVIEDLLVPSQKPILAGFRAGHCEPKITLPLGSMIEMDSYNKTVILKESCLIK